MLAQSTSCSCVVELRANQIRAVEFHDVVVTDQMSKLEVFTNYYAPLLGSESPSNWQFDLHSLYSGQQAVDQDRLEAPVTLPEAKMVVQSMNQNSAPGPDGFGLGF